MPRQKRAICATCSAECWQQPGKEPRCRTCWANRCAGPALHDKVCERCSAAFQSRNRRARFCSKPCAAPPPRVCEVCESPYRATYYQQRTCSRECGNLINSGYGKTCRIEWRTCLVCDRVHTAKSGKAYDTCSEDCRGKAHSILFPSKVVDRSWQTAEHECPMCGERFTNAHTPVVVHCSIRCSRKARKQRRRVREAGTYGEWRWSDFMRIARKFNYCCAYCGEKPDRLDPDHVVPLSKGGPNIVGNLLPTCSTCNSDKQAYSLDEWADRRTAAGRPPRHTSWAPEDKRYWHLTVLRSDVAA